MTILCLKMVLLIKEVLTLLLVSQNFFHKDDSLFSFLSSFLSTSLTPAMYLSPRKSLLSWGLFQEKWGYR